MSGGRNAGAEPRRLLPLLCKAGGLTKDDVGAIRVQADQSYVQILETSVSKFLDTVGGDMTLEPGAVLAQLDEAPKLERQGRPGGRFDRKPDRGPRKHKAPRPTGERDYKKEQRAPETRDTGDKDSAPTKTFKRPKPHRKGGDAAPRRYTVEEWSDLSGKKPRHKRKGPPPPVGKPNSKKNKARAAAKAAQAGKGGGKKSR